MKRMQTVEIDFDVYKRIQLERHGYDDSENDALRRLLGMGEVQHQIPSVELLNGQRSWRDGDVILPHQTDLRMSYGRASHQGQIVDGKWVVAGKVFDTPSGAASGVARTKKGKATRLDGWNYWEVKRPGDREWKALSTLRPRRVIVTNRSTKELGL